jgi:hypothetical protein
VFFSESANSNNPISLQVPELCFKQLYTVSGVEQTDMGLKYKRTFTQAMEIFKIIGLGVDNKTISIE